MYLYEAGISSTYMYGHYNYYAIYKLKNDSYKVYKKTFTDSTIYDDSKNWSLKKYNKVCVKNARLSVPVIIDRNLLRKYISRAF